MVAIPQLTIASFGRIALRCNEQPLVGLASRKAEALVIYLACHRAQPLLRSQLAEYFWPDLPESRARGNLSVLLTSLRRAAPGLLRSDRQTVQIESQVHLSFDWLDLQAAWQQAEAERPLQPATASQLRALLARCQGPFLADLPPIAHPEFESWLTSTQAAAHEVIAAALQRLAEEAHERTAYREAADWAARAHAHDPLSETAATSLIRALNADQRREAALRVYREFSATLEAELALQPGPALQALVTEIRSARAQPRPALDRPQNGLVHLPTLHAPPILGREREVAQVQAMLADPTCRLLTITGPGGIGKTSFARTFAAHLQRHASARFRDGVVWLELAAVADPRHVAGLIAAQLRLELANGPLATQLAMALSGRALLLVLDNLEQLIEPEQHLGHLCQALLDHAPHLVIITTSRQRLGLREEYLFPLAGLARQADADPAVALFFRQAARFRPQAAPSAEARAAVGALCRALDDLPLAIELAAAWSRSLPPAAIAEALQRGDDALLQSEDLGIPDRHRSMRTVIAQSWQRLAPAAQQVLAALAYCANGCDLAAASAIAPPSDQPIATSLTALVDASLLHFDGEARYRLHTLVRQYVLATPMAHDLRATIVARHWRYFAQFAANGAGFGRREQPALLARFQPERENLLLACRSATEAAAPESASLVRGLSAYLIASGQLPAGADYFQSLLGSPHTPPIAGQLHLAFALFAEALGDYQAADTALEQAMPNLTDSYDRLAAAYLRGRIADRRGEFAAASTIFAQLRAEAHALGSERDIVLALLGLASTAEGLRCYHESAAYVSEALQRAEASGELGLAARALNNLGLAHEMLGDLTSAEYHYQQSLAAYQELRDQPGSLIPLSNLCDVAATRGDLAAARGYGQASLRIADQIGAVPQILMLCVKLAEVELAAGRAANALELLIVPQQSMAIEHAFRQRAFQFAERARAQLDPAASHAATARGQQHVLASLAAFALSLD